MSRQAFVFVNDALAAKKMDGVHVRITVDDCFRLMEALQENAEVFKKQGASIMLRCAMPAGSLSAGWISAAITRLIKFTDIV